MEGVSEDPVIEQSEVHPGGEEVVEDSSGPSTEVDRDSPTTENSSAEDPIAWLTTPIVCVDRGSQPAARRIPAVKIISDGGEWVIVPLALDELGVMFDEHHDFTEWECYDIRGGWRSAKVEFQELVEYSPQVLELLMDALRIGRFKSGETLNLGSWSSLCWGRETPLKIDVTCSKCEKERTLPLRHLPVLPSDLSKFHCQVIGVACSSPLSLPSVAKKREAPSSKGYYTPELAVPCKAEKPTPKCLTSAPRVLPGDSALREARRTITLQANLHANNTTVSLPGQQKGWGIALRGVTAQNVESRAAVNIPHPREFIVGVEATRFENPDPTEEQLVEFYDFRNSSEWRHYTKILQRPGGGAASFQLEGKDDVIQFRDWEKRIRYQFDSWVLVNPVIKAELAMMTFVFTAQDWWGSQRQRHPQLRITFPQLCEWITTELVPSASLASALEAWTCLEFTGDLERYFRQLDDLRFYHSIDPTAAHSIAAKPFGPEFQARIRAMDKEMGEGGIAFPTLKELIRAHCAERGSYPRAVKGPELQKGNARLRDALPARAALFEKRERKSSGVPASNTKSVNTNWRATPPNSIPLPKQSPYEAREFFCLVCGDSQHIWPQCDRKQSKGCAACASEAHLVRNCSQRWKHSTTTPHRWDQTATSTEGRSQGWDLSSEEVQNKEDTVIARRVGVYPSSHHNPFSQRRRDQRHQYSERLTQTTAHVLEKGETATRKEIWPVQEVFVDPNIGVSPCKANGARGELLYPIQVNDFSTTALWDPGAGASFISTKRVAELGLTPTPLPRPIRLEVWDGPGTVITHQAWVRKVKLGTKEGSWPFMIDPRPPHDVVLGIDLSRKWHLTVNPHNDHLISIAPSEPKVSEVLGSASWDDGHLATLESEDRDRDRRDFPIKDWEEGVCVHTLLCTKRAEQETLTLKEGAENDFVVSRTLHSVTAGTAAEKEEQEQILKGMDAEMASLVHEFPNLFKPPDSVPPERLVKHHIHLKPNALPVRRSPYLVGGEKLQAMKEQIQQLQQQGWIEPAASPWGAPVLFVPKKEKVFRMCGDFRDLNALTVDDSFPLPRVEVMLHRAGGATVFSKIDLASGFHQIALTEESKPLTAFCLPQPVEGNCLWQWTVMPFGLKNAPPTFQRAMTHALKGCEEFSVVYIDDILVFSKTPEEHLAHLRQVFEKLDREAYHVRLTKCLFRCDEVEFLGHRLSSKGLQTSPIKMEALQAWQPPFLKAKYVKQFLGLVLWYKSFIPHLATIAAPLFPLTSSKKNFEWSEAATAAVRTLQKQITQAPCLARWDPVLPTRVITDASQIGIAAVLEQRHVSGWRPVAFWSRRLKDAETRYHTTDREWLAVVEAVSRRWKGFLEGQAFQVCSDHMALARKLTKSSHDPPVTDRQSRWIEALMPFAITFEYIKGKDNTVADALSRCPVAARSVAVVKSVQFGFLGWMRLAAKNDAEYQRLLQLTAEDPTKGEIHLGLLKRPDGTWFVPQDDDLRTALLSEAHDTVYSGHFGALKTLKTLGRNWYWPSMREDVAEYVQTCVRCQKVKTPTHKAPGLLHPITAPLPGHTVTLDFVSKFTPADKTKNDQCLVIVDKFSKFVMLKGCRSSITAEETASIFCEKVFPLFGAPRVVISDRGPQFTAQFWGELMTLMQTKVAIASSHHPQTDGQSERVIQTLLRLIRTYATQNQSKWETHLPMFEVALNSVNHAATGMSPHRILFGQDARVPSTFLVEEIQGIPMDRGCEETTVPPKLRQWFKRCQDVWRLVYERQEAANQRSKEAYDRNRKTAHFNPGDLVLLSTSSHAALAGVRKHRERFVGPYLVQGMIHPNAYCLKGLPPGVPVTQNVRFLRPFHPNVAKFSSRPTPEYAAPVIVSGHVEWEVEAIVGHRLLRHGMKYRIKWKDTPQEQWLPSSALRHCRRLVTEYHRQHNLPLPTESFEDPPNSVGNPTVR